jgi:hypothetical protein
MQAVEAANEAKMSVAREAHARQLLELAEENETKLLKAQEEHQVCAFSLCVTTWTPTRRNRFCLPESACVLLRLFLSGSRSSARACQLATSTYQALREWAVKFALTISQDLCNRLEGEHQLAVEAAHKEFQELRAFLSSHNESVTEEARRRFAEAVQAAQVSGCLLMHDKSSTLKPLATRIQQGKIRCARARMHQGLGLPIT